MTIVGVAKDAVQNSWSDERMPEVYLPYLQTTSYLEGPESHNTYLTLVMRTAGDPAALAASARGAIWSIDSGVAIADVITMEAAIGSALARPRFQFMLLGLFAMVALLLAAAGIYSVMSYAISRRTQEIGLRLTLGAQRGDVLRLVLGQAMIRVAIGSAIGLDRRAAADAPDVESALRRAADRSDHVRGGVARADRRGAARQLHSRAPCFAHRSDGRPAAGIDPRDACVVRVRHSAVCRGSADAAGYSLRSAIIGSTRVARRAGM